MQQLHCFRGRRFIWAGAVHDDLPIACRDEAAGFDLIEMHHHGARNSTLVQLIRITSANVDQLDRFARVNQRAQLLHVDARYADRQCDAPAPPAPSDVKREQDRKNSDRFPSENDELLKHEIDLFIQQHARANHD